jgi:hypothetical protein
METVDVHHWKAAPTWLYWVAAVLSPLFIAFGVLLCVTLSLILGQEPISSKRVQYLRRPH